ncbi:CheR family methyltransferase [Natranaerofaba carboxydovora]|uniref:CheR family methyltransferase n=1 Tax=Natranaerofaba carboxydovora TaxID=2742683 RepID=UPI001F13C10D|nr:protein-glutamate O-methyltransferase CheR [Natranaerofaba carboxydovora]UMZ73049.1 Chemotaxis protein methyltransferase Cher2 [Natranaerofaba carboxydovora]
MLKLTTKEFQLLAEYIKNNYGITLKDEKKHLVLSRLQNVVKQMDFSSFTEYYNHLVADTSGCSVSVLIDKITTNHTYFMREAKHFYYFRDEVLPYLKETVKDKDLRIWCAACSTGEEPYTLAMIIDEFFGEEKRYWNTQILATDISHSALETAKKGIYSNEQLLPLAKRWKISYFKKIDNDNSLIVEKLKKEVIFRKLNLTDRTFPFKKKLHVIFCRNVMIYFDNEIKEKLVERLYYSLEEGGFLFISHSESLNRAKTKFKYILPGVYRK